MPVPHGIKEKLETDVLPALIRALALRRPEISNPSELLSRALSLLVAILLGLADFKSMAHLSGLPPRRDDYADTLTPEQVGQLYEYFRGFRLEIGSDAEPLLTPCGHGKRNQGLFYTPATIVRRIVNSSLDALGITNAEDYLHLRVLDPAVGTGTFLLEALEQLTRRVMAGAGQGQSRVANVCTRVRGLLRSHGLKVHVDKEAAVRLYIMSRCLYGVDLDGVAVKIAQAALRNRAMKGLAPLPDLEPSIRVGNALIGQATGDPSAMDRAEEDERHATEYFYPKTLDELIVRRWPEQKKVLHWPLEYPEIFGSDRGGFDCVIGNPPYEILSVKESGIENRRSEQAYFRAMYKTCQGKINTYRLMTERGLTLLRDGGVLGFIVPATLLADSTAAKLRRLLLDTSEVQEALVIPEKAQAFPGVTQAFLVLVCRKGQPTLALEPVEWNGAGPVLKPPGVSVDRKLLTTTGFRIPCLRSVGEKELLQALAQYPPLAGDSRHAAVGRVHQGEVNLTVHREFITTSETAYPLIRGEHVTPLQVSHPSSRGGRLDWVVPEFLGVHADRQVPLPIDMPESHGRSSRFRLNPWENPRIVLGRVVNMDTDRRLKAAPVSPGCFLGDMTNSITDLTLPRDYLLGLLNSRLLNWRIKLTSTNNYLSAAEVEALPMPRPSGNPLPADLVASTQQRFTALRSEVDGSLSDWLARIQTLIASVDSDQADRLLVHVVKWTVSAIREEHGNHNSNAAIRTWNALDAAVLLRYGCEAFVDVVS